MDFGTLLHVAKKNNDRKTTEGNYYRTKFEPPKKESKEKKLSDNIQKFLQKREKEEMERKRAEREKLQNLLAMRDEKSKNKIRKMLKVTKSANKSVLEDAISVDTAVTMTGPEQPDQDDYGYVSTEASAFYQKYIEKVKDVKDDKGFAPSRPNSITDLKGTKERVKAAITRDYDDKKGTSRQRTSHASSETPQSTSSSSSSAIRAYGSTKSLYDPAAERQEEDRRKKEEEQKKAKQRKPPPPPMDFQALLKLAEKKQHEPVQIVVDIKKAKEPERLLTLKEKRELEERKRAKEMRERKEKEQTRPKDDRERKNAIAASSSTRNEIPKQNKSTNLKVTGAPFNGSIPKLAPTYKPTPQALPNKSSKHTPPPLQKKETLTPMKPSTSIKKNIPSSSNSTAVKKLYNESSRPFPSGNVQSVKPRSFPPPDMRRTESHVKQAPKASKRRIIDDEDEDDYDSEMDDFIDDGEDEQDYSSHIKAIFGYDKSRYRDLDEDDDRAMESNFSQIQREEYVSKKIGLQEDLEDMRQEALEKKRKMLKKKRL